MELLEIGKPNNRDMRGSRQRIGEALSAAAQELCTTLSRC